VLVASGRGRGVRIGGIVGGDGIVLVAGVVGVVGARTGRGVGRTHVCISTPVRDGVVKIVMGGRLKAKGFSRLAADAVRDHREWTRNHEYLVSSEKQYYRRMRWSGS